MEVDDCYTGNNKEQLKNPADTQLSNTLERA